MNPYYGYGYVPQGYGEIAPQGFFGSLLGGIGGGLAGKAIGGLFGNPTLGEQIGNVAGGIGGSFLPFQIDPIIYQNAVGLSPQSFLVPQTFQDAEAEALNAFYEDASRKLLQHLGEYIEANKPDYGNQINDAIPLVQRAADLYETRNYHGAFLQLQQVYRFLIRLRAKTQGLPIP
jgi:hypothetical protein